MKVYIGIDWSQNKHDLCVLNQAGAYLAEAFGGQAALHRAGQSLGERLYRIVQRQDAR